MSFVLPPSLILPPALVRPANDLRRGLFFPPFVGAGLSAAPPSFAMTPHGLFSFSNGSGNASGSFTPANGGLLVALLTYQRNNNGPTIALSGGGLSWARQLQASNGAGWDTLAEIWAAPVAAGTSMSVQITASNIASDGTGTASIYEFSGQNASPFGRSATGQGGSRSGGGAYSLSLGGATAASSILLGAVVQDQDGSGALVAATGYTAHVDQKGGNSWLNNLHVSAPGARSNFELANLYGYYSHAVVALEIKSA